MSDALPPAPAQPPRALSLGMFLTGTPTLEIRRVQVSVNLAVHGKSAQLQLPAIQLHCVDQSCVGARFFDPNEGGYLDRFQTGDWCDTFFDYRCRNCHRVRKTYAIRLRPVGGDAKNIDIQKFGEIPAFGEPRPNLIKDVLDDEIEYLDRGYRAETAGLGIGAFAYYRRFVDSHKNKIITEIRKVAAAQGAKQETLDTLDRALKTNSFENAVKTVKDAIPDGLKYQGGHNPLTLLYSALSRGLHSDDDVECLEIAKDMRLVLTDLAERTAQALKNSAELGAAVSRLLGKGARK